MYLYESRSGITLLFYFCFCFCFFCFSLLLLLLFFVLFFWEKVVRTIYESRWSGRIAVLLLYVWADTKWEYKVRVFYSQYVKKAVFRSIVRNHWPVISHASKLYLFFHENLQYILYYIFYFNIYYIKII